MLSHNTGKSYDEIARDTDRDFYLSAEQAVEYSLIDEILGAKTDSKDDAKADSKDDAKAESK
jgi:ATP-dependent Clp protease protease subunit